MGRTVLVASPRGFCAGVSYAIEIVDLLLDRHGPPVYVRHEIVHNRHVVDRLRRKGARFVEDLAEVPAGSLLVFSAHGVAPSVRTEARSRGFRVVDATCPLVAKVHLQVLKHARDGFDILMVGHRGHVEVTGTMGHAPDRMQLVETAGDVERVVVRDPERVAVVMQTTLSVGDARGILDAITRRFPAARTPPTDDICYATQNRQTAVKHLARNSDGLLVIGSRTSSNATRLAEVARAAGTPAHLIDDAADIDPAWLRDATTVGVTAGASTPEELVRGVVGFLRTQGFDDVRDVHVVDEDVSFPLPRELRGEPAAVSA